RQARRYHRRLAKATTPKPTSMAPDRRLIHRNRCGVTRARTRATPLLRSTHHRADPTRTPRTSTTAAPEARPIVPTPKPAKIAAKERIVGGLASVSATAEMYARSGVDPAAVAARSAGGAAMVLTPR